ncbi:MAG: acyltransferase family protein [Paracoccus sp. (in: a-proteobacteria)]|uniref:acyltransferase family protein n=1 Tax=Paracoccus sp. TaxID=267 RepID=UPI00405885A3
MSPVTHRYPSIDYLRVILACCVVFAHTVLMTGYEFRWMTEIGYGLLRLVVPTFALLSGFGLFHTAIRNRLSGWLRGLVILYATWVIIYAPLWLRPVESGAEVLHQVVNGPMHLWYVACLVQIVAIIWLVRQTVPVRHQGMALAAAAVLAAIVASLAQYNDRYAFVGPWFALPRANVLYLLPFVVEGFLLAHWIARRGRGALPSAVLLWGLVAGLLVLRLVEVRWLMDTGAVPLKDPPEFPVLLYLVPVLIVMAVMRMDVPATRLNLSSASVIIYLMHIGIIFAFITIGITHMWLVLATAIVVPFLSAMALPHVPIVSGINRKLSRTSSVPRS